MATHLEHSVREAHIYIYYIREVQIQIYMYYIREVQIYINTYYRNVYIYLCKSFDDNNPQFPVGNFGTLIILDCALFNNAPVLRTDCNVLLLL